MIWVIFAALVICVLLLWRNFFAGILWRAGVPALEWHNPLRNITAQFENTAALAQENKILRAELASTTATLADRNLLYKENLSLKARLGHDVGIRSVLAGIVLRPPGVPYDTLMIDAGRAQGISQGDLVSAGGTTYVGTVDTVYPTAARVVLFSSPGESYQALLSQTDAHPPLPITVVGQGNGSLVAEVPAETTVVPGDEVVLPGIAGGYAAAVSHVDLQAGESFEKVYLHLPANPQELQYVEVVLH